MSADGAARQPLDLDQTRVDLEDCWRGNHAATAVRIAQTLLAEVEALRAERDGAVQRWEWGTRLTWPSGTVEDRWCYRDRDDAAAQVRYFAEMAPQANPGGSLYGTTATLIRRLHLTLPAEMVEEAP